jgi:hypothetical protein
MIQYHLELGIYSKKYSAEEIADILGIPYDKCWKMGMPRSTSSDIMKFEQHAWFIMSEPCLNQTPLDAQVKQIFLRIQPSLPKFPILFSDCDIYFNCTIEGDENPEIHFEKETISLMCSIKASLDIDTYIA